jgi:hypothetical protein
MYRSVNDLQPEKPASMAIAAAAEQARAVHPNARIVPTPR